MSPVRYRFGPALNQELVRPVVDGELPDPSVTASISDVRAGDPGEVDLDVSFAIMAYDPKLFTSLTELHAIAYPPGSTLDASPAAALASANPKGMQDVTGQTSGVTSVVTIEGAPPGQVTILTVCGYVDPPSPTPPPDPTTPATPADPSAPATPPVAAPIPGPTEPPTTS